MDLFHVGCGGEIDVKKRQCLKCKHKWGRMAFLTTPNEIRQVVKSKAARASALRQKVDKPTRHAKWAENIPGATLLPSMLPSWPRWARLLSTAVVLGIITTVIVLIVKGC